MSVNSTQAGNENLVVLVTTVVLPRVCKIGYGLKNNGFRVVLVHRDDPNTYIAELSPCFDECHHFTNIEMALALAKQFNPIVYHVFSVWDYECAARFIASKIGKIVFDDFDVMAGMVRPDFALRHYGKQLELERYCIENANGLCCRSLEIQYARRQLGYHVKGRVLFYLDHCWDRPLVVENERPKKAESELHIVYAGCIAIEKQYPEGSRRDGFFLEFSRGMAQAKIHFHIYLPPTRCDNFDDDYSDYISLDQETPFFHLHRPVPADQLSSEIAKYDLALISAHSDVINKQDEAYTPLKRSYCTPHKVFEYLDAGLGIIIGDYRNIRQMLERTGCAAFCHLEDVKTMLLSQPRSHWQELKARARAARHHFSTILQAKRLVDFYCALQGPEKYIPSKQKVGAVVPEAIYLKEKEGKNQSSYPRIFSVETSLACDLRCPECAIGGGNITRPRGFMSFDQFKGIADKIRPYCEYLYLHLWGEPLLNRDIIAMIKYASQFTRTNISTNGMSLSPQIAEELITSGVTDILFSIDGMTQETYEKYRVGGDFYQAVNALKMLQHVNQKHGSPVKIVPQFVVFKHNQHEMETFQNFWRLFGLEASFKAPYIRKASKFQHSDLPEYVRASYPNVQSLYAAMSTCQDPQKVLTVLRDGSVVACCYDHNNDTSFGNIFKQEVMDIWNSQGLINFRKKMQSGDPPDFCKNACLLYRLEEPVRTRTGKRTKKEIDVGNFQRALEYARGKYGTAEYPECFDAYEQLVYAYPQVQVQLLAEIYNQYRPLESQSRYQLYQSRFFEFDIRPGDKVLDIGSGHLPFPYATHLADLSLEEDRIGRAGVPFKHVAGKPVFECSIEDLPFEDEEFDFVYCSHVLEHVNSPEMACKEIMRVGKRGFIETPGPGKDLWLNSAQISKHKWSIELKRDQLFFKEYTADEIVGFNCGILMDMNCAPQTPREKAFAALLNLRADLVNTMLYWENRFKVEVQRKEVEPLPVSAADKVTLPLPTTVASPGPELCLFINTYYGSFLDSVYRKNPGLKQEPYTLQKSILQNECFGDSDFYSYWLTMVGFSGDDLIVNCRQLQTAWGIENGCSAVDAQMVIEQIRREKPAVVYLQDLNNTSRAILEAIRPLTQLIVGQIATPVQGRIPFDCYDIIFSSFPHYVSKFRAAGLTSYWQALAFDPRVLGKINVPSYMDRTIGCSFVGGISALHKQSYRLLELLAEKTPIKFWGYGVDTLPVGSLVRDRHHGEAWGKQMFDILGQSRITINRHGEVAENYANNMRLFEATGCGSLLITDYKDNLNELFEIGTEIVAFRSPEECVGLVNYYLSHPDEAEVIARAGQARTLREHSYGQRMTQTAEILKRHLRYNREKGSIKIPDRISDGHQTILKTEVTPQMTAAWKNPMIPLRQRALVQHELLQMYKGKIAVPFQVLADTLKPIVSNGDSVLEIGCASGYYYEILEYLLNRRIAYTGVDYSDAMILMARDYYPNVSFHAADGANLIFPDRQFDVAISSGVLLHVPNWRQHVSETTRVAGQYVVASRTPVCKNKPTQYMKKFAYGVETVEVLFNEAEIIHEFQINGLKLVNANQYHSDPAHDEYQVTYLFRRQ